MHDPIHHHIAAIAEGHEPDAEKLARSLWPAGAEGAHPAAREWLRRWAPKREVVWLSCGCTAGRCSICN